MIITFTQAEVIAACREKIERDLHAQVSAIRVKVHEENRDQHITVECEVIRKTAPVGPVPR
jgi:hypothetical protein